MAPVREAVDTVGGEEGGNGLADAGAVGRRRDPTDTGIHLDRVETFQLLDVDDVVLFQDCEVNGFGGQVVQPAHAICWKTMSPRPGGW